MLALVLQTPAILGSLLADRSPLLPILVLGLAGGIAIVGLVWIHRILSPPPDGSSFRATRHGTVSRTGTAAFAVFLALVGALAVLVFARLG